MGDERDLAVTNPFSHQTLRREARSSFGAFAGIVSPRVRERHGPGRWWSFARAMFFRLSPVRRVILLFALALLVSFLVMPGSGEPWPAMNRVLLSAACLLLLLALELADRVALKRDLEVAREIQNWLVPRVPPQVPGLDIAFRTRPANTVAGDYYDVLRLPQSMEESSGALLLVVADVAGKGIPSGLLMAGFRSCLHTLAGSGCSFHDLVAQLQIFCAADSDEGRHFTSAFLATYAPGMRTLLYVNAGHNPPFLRRSSGKVDLLEAGGVPFGIFPHAQYEFRSIRMDPGDLLLVYTDGVVEAVNEAGEEYGSERLSRLVTGARATSAEIQTQVFASVDAFASGASQFDDVTTLVVQWGA